MNDSTGMRPQLGQTTMSLPITFDYTGGRRDKLKQQKTWAIILGVVGVLIALLYTIKGPHFFLIDLVFSIIGLYILAFIIRFFILKEGKYREEFITLDESNGVEDVKEIWGIYNISKNYPYTCRFRNGKSGMVILLNKDVVLGKYSDAEFEHYEAIADAYNIAGGSKIQMCHIDYMANIGMDERLDESFIGLKDVDNEDIKDLLTDVYTYLKQQMLERVTTYDAYAFLWTGSDIAAWNTIQGILSCFLEANYRSYQVMDMDGLRELTKTIFNLNDFSVVNAMLNAFDETSVANVVPITLVRADGSTEVLGKTQEQRRKEAELAQKEQELKKQKRIEERKNRKTKDEPKKPAEKDSIDWDEEIEI